MGISAAGTVVTIDFPFSVLSATKRRPALVLAQANKQGRYYPVPNNQQTLL